jgi:hypothetical protein
VYCEIRPLALNQHNIESAWRKSGLLPLDRDVVLSRLKRPSLQEKEPAMESQINAQIETEIQYALTLNPSNLSKSSNPSNPSNPLNSRPSTACGAPPSLDLKTPEIEVVLPLRLTFKTPSNLVDLQNLKELFVQRQNDQNLLFEKAIKAAQYGIAKSTVAEAMNQDLVDAADEARKRRNKVSGKNGKA